MAYLRIYPETLTSLQQGDRAAFDLVFRKYYGALCLFAQRVVGDKEASKDAVEDVFVRLWRRGQAFNDELHLKMFLYTAVRNKSLEYLRGTRHAGERQLEFTLANSDNTQPYETDIIRAEVIRELYQAIQSLPTQCGRVISLTYIEGMSNQQAADELGLSVNTIKAQKQRGLILLKDKMGGFAPQLLTLIPCVEAVKRLF